MTGSLPGGQGLEMDSLLTQYGRAMARVGQLEEQVSSLRLQLDQMGTSPEAAGLQEQLREAHRLLKERDDALAALRLQVAGLNTQLAESEERLKEAAQGNYARVRHRRHHRSLWRRLRRVMNSRG